MALAALPNMWYGKYFLLFPTPYLLKKVSIHTHSGLSNCVSGCTITALGDDENSVSCELRDLLEKRGISDYFENLLSPFTTFQLEMRKGAQPAVFILMSVPVGVTTKKIINIGLKLHLNSGTCSNVHYVQRWDNDTLFQIFTKWEKPKVWEYFKAVVSQQHQQSVKLLFCMT